MPSESPLPVLDLAHLSAMTGGDAELSQEVIGIFREQAQIWSRLLDPLSEARQWADAAHTLKGASLGIGALKLAAACERAEKAGRAETPPSPAHASVLISEIKDALGETLEAAARAAYDLASAAKRSAS
ncbi:Hpt domain-containing protein [Hyphomonas sp. WL0036]|uniref:Hpt domain-containing protein n=1 Tax=Hyphomonas sediminis TaxID=2866160 RepID=UPI001C7FF8DF|nr:Hpt domain-containing protein [Hyphomonas sediminis]MBY9065702.1 Hpt domain-containing protein [Hyphomonas sediminis]